MISYIGIDLGQKGAISVQSKLAGFKPTWSIYPFHARHNEETRKRTLTDQELFETLKKIISTSGETFITVERPVFVPSNGKKAIAVLHENYGFVKGALQGLGVSTFWFPTPMQWKKVAQAYGNQKSKMLKQASNLCKSPNLSIDTADSVLICEACRLRFT